MVLTAGHKLLRKWVREAPRQRSAARLAAFLGCSRPAVSGWLRGDTRPDCRYWPSLQLVTGIPVHEWISREEEEEMERARRKLASGSPFAGGAP
jgi:transcriptional regulator with XRE-family HTH domain